MSFDIEVRTRGRHRETVRPADVAAGAPGAPRQADQKREGKVDGELELCRRRLLDLSARNPLLNYRPSRGHVGVTISDEISRELYHRLVEQGDSMSFRESPDAPDDGDLDPDLMPQPDYDEEHPAERYTDNEIQTSHGSKSLHLRLLNSRRKARLQIEEQGESGLYLALAMLKWRDPRTGMKEHKAPLLLVPVTIERAGVKSRFQVRHAGDEVEGNLALTIKLKQEFGIELPQAGNGSFDIDRYFAQVGEALALAAGPLRDRLGEEVHFEVCENESALGFFSSSDILMYRDLVPEKFPERRRPAHHPLAARLLGDPSMPVRSAEAAREPFNPGQDLIVLPADTSQLRAQQALEAGMHLDVEGPPGTGKSDTIVNVIARGVSAGKKVLFVSEKRAAMEVVHERLRRTGLGDACLLLSANDITKTAVLSELKRTLELGEPVRPEREAEMRSYSQAVEHLSRHAEILAREIPGSGRTAYQLLAELSATDRSALLRFQSEALKDWSGSELQAVEQAVEQLDTALGPMNPPICHPFFGSLRCDLSAEAESAIDGRLSQLLESLEGYRQALKVIIESLGFDEAGGEEAPGVLLDLLTAIHESPLEHHDLEGISPESSCWLQDRDLVTSAISSGLRYQELRDEWRERLEDSAFSAEGISELKTELKLAGDNWLTRAWRYARHREYRQACTTLEVLCRNRPPVALEKRLALCDALIEAQRCARGFQDCDQRGRELFGDHWRGELSNWKRLQRVNDFLPGFVAASQFHPCRERLLALLRQPDLVNGLTAELRIAQEKRGTFEQIRSALLDQLQIDDRRRTVFDGLPLDGQLDKFSSWKKELSRLRELCAYNRAAEGCRQAGAGFVVTAVEQSQIELPSLAASLGYSWRAGKRDQLLARYPQLEAFSAQRQEQLINELEKAHDKLLQANAALIAHCHHASLPHANLGGQFALLSREMNKKSHRLSLRRLFEQAGDAVQQVKPVWIMSPETLVRLIGQNSVEFDMVLIDEGSQLRSEKALSAILRCRPEGVVGVFGDRQQLKPTSFFRKQSEGEETGEPDQAAETKGLESILDLFAAARVPQRMLMNHYRSRKPGLIALSNQEFYDGRLRVYPSPDAGVAASGITYHYVTDGEYERGRGKSRKNRAEARCVADAILEHALTRPEVSLGAETLSRQQMEAVEVELERRRRELAEAAGRQSEFQAVEEFLEGERPEPFFLKNLENVQGDERDVIHMSIGYGRDSSGALTMNFGPLNQSGGPERLNTLISRARVEMHVYTSLDPDDIRITNTSPRGLRVLKAYLEFAKTGRLKGIPDSKSRPLDPLQADIKKALETEGFEVTANVGVSGVFVDLAVHDPRDRNRFILGLMTDGANCQTAESQFDRQVSQTQQLRRLGWNIERAWVLEWLEHREQVLDRIKRAITKVQTAPPPSAEAPPVLHAAQLPVRAPAAAPDADAVKVYACYDDEIVDPLAGEFIPAFTLSTPAQMQQYVIPIVRAEGPVHKENVVDRFLQRSAHPLQEPRKLRDRIELALSLAAADGHLVEEGDFYRIPGEPVIFRRRGNLLADERHVKRVAACELDAAVLYIVKNSCGIERDELPRACAVLLELGRTSPTIKETVDARVTALLAGGALRESEREGKNFIFLGRLV